MLGIEQGMKEKGLKSWQKKLHVRRYLREVSPISHPCKLCLRCCVEDHCQMCVVENFKQFLTNVARVSETTLPEEFSYRDSVILDLVKFAELRVNECKGRSKRMTKGHKLVSVLQVIPWVSIIKIFMCNGTNVHCESKKLGHFIFTVTSAYVDRF